MLGVVLQTSCESLQFGRMDLSQIFFRYCVYYPVVYLRQEHVPYYLRQLEQSQWASKAKLEQLQERKLNDLISEIRIQLPFYRESLKDLAVDSSLPLKHLASLPFVTKSNIQASYEMFLVKKRRYLLTKKTTGGSTGQAVTIWKTRDAIAQEAAANWRGFSWAGIKIGDRQGRFWGVPFSSKDMLRVKLVDFINHRKRCSAFSFTEKDMAAYTNLLNRFKPRYLYGYVSMLATYAEFLKSTGKRLAFGLQAVITTSEVLTAHHRQLLEETFGARVYNEYGCGELGTIAHECEKRSMHINAENMVVEILNGERLCSPGEVGEVVVTELNNRAMPLVRYRLGDFASFSETACECGRSLPVIKNVAGRAYDIVYNREGQMFHGEFFMYILEEVKRRGLGVRSFQVIQEDYDNFTVRLQPGDGYGVETEKLIKDRIWTGYGNYAKINIVRVDKIDRERSGKVRLIIGMPSRIAARPERWGEKMSDNNFLDNLS